MAQTLYYISPDFMLCKLAKIEHDIYNEGNTIDQDLADKFPIAGWGSDQDLAGWTAYNIQGNSPVTIAALDALQADLKAFSELPATPQDGVLYDSDDQSYTEWDDLSEELQADIIAANWGQSLPDNDNQYWYSNVTIAGFYSDAISDMIEAIQNDSSFVTSDVED